MSFLVAAVLLPCLFWDKGPETINLSNRAQVRQICVPAAVADSWKSAAGVSVDVVDPKRLTRVPTPSVVFHPEEASATRAPWVNSNGWRFLRQPDGHFYYEAPGTAASLAAAEAFTYRVNAVIHTAESGVEPFEKMLAFMQAVGSEDLPPLVNIGFIDDGSPQSGEFMNLLVRRNLLFRVVKKPDPKLDLTVALGSAQYPRSEAGNPSLLAEQVRSNLTDEKRLLRLYGSEVVVGRLFANGDRTRLYLLNYAAARSPVQGIRIRVAGVFHRCDIAEYDMPNARLLDVNTASGATEFTIPELKSLAVITLFQ